MEAFPAFSKRGTNTGGSRGASGNGEQMQAQATLHTQFNITAMYFSGRFDFISFWLSYPTITLIQVLATKNSEGECLWRTLHKGCIFRCYRGLQSFEEC